MGSLQRFYDNYHKKNDNYAKVILDNNFTYFYILQRFQEGGKTRPKYKLLDVGCGVGTLALYFASKGAQVVGIDISKRAIEIANTAKEQLHLKNVRFQLGEVAKGNQEFDFVICSEVVEHIRDEKAFINNIHSHLKKGGTLLLTTPSKNNLLYALGYYKKFDKEVGHLRRYTPESLKKLLVANGFKIMSLAEVEGPLRNILFTSPLGFLIRFIKGPLIPLFHVVDSWSAKLFGASDLQVLAKKV